MTRYASIVPLIGGETFAMQNVFGSKPEYIMSYKDFGDSKWFYSAPAGRASRLATISFKS